MTTQRFMVDECGTLIDMESRNTYDYVSEVCGLLNELSEENEQLKQQLQSILKLTKKIEDYTYDMKLIGDLE